MKLTATLTLFTLLVTPSVFAETRHPAETDTMRTRPRTVTVEGRIHDIERSRRGFVIRLDGDEATLFASSQTDVYSDSGRRNTGPRQLERGDFIRATGFLGSRGMINADSITVVRNDDNRDERTLRGMVQSVDVRQRVVLIRENRTGRVIAADFRGAERNDRRWDNERDNRWSDLRNIRRGDRIVAGGEWRDNRFEAERFDIGENERR